MKLKNGLVFVAVLLLFGVFIFNQGYLDGFIYSEEDNALSEAKTFLNNQEIITYEIQSVHEDEQFIVLDLKGYKNKSLQFKVYKDHDTEDLFAKKCLQSNESIDFSLLKREEVLPRNRKEKEGWIKVDCSSSG